MNRVIIFISFLFVLSLFSLCNSTSSSKEEQKYFYLGDKEPLKQSTINELSNSYSIGFAQYEGFFINLTDSVFKRIYLIIEKQNIIDSDNLSDKKISSLKNSKVV